jgi:predicted NAD/FAD-binding protein
MDIKDILNKISEVLLFDKEYRCYNIYFRNKINEKDFDDFLITSSMDKLNIVKFLEPTPSRVWTGQFRDLKENDEIKFVKLFNDKLNSKSKEDSCVQKILLEIELNK